MRLVLIIFSVFTIGNINGQQTDSLSSKQIINNSIIFCGGEERISKIKTTELSYVYLTNDNKQVSISDKIVSGKKYSQSILSYEFQSQSTFFNGDEFTRVDGKDIIKISDINSVEEIKLKTYNQLQYAYVKEEYELTRLEDEKFNYFDCYVIEAKAKNGYSTINFFDKTNFRLLMVVYPTGGKSCFIKYKYIDGVLFNSTILNITSSNEQQELILLDTKINLDFSNLWFNCPYKEEVYIPSHIREGEFESTNGDKTLFTRTKKSQDYKDHEGKTSLRRFLKWANNDTYGLIDEKAILNAETIPESEILVRVISWDNDNYVCHWIAGEYMGTQDYKIKDNVD